MSEKPEVPAKAHTNDMLTSTNRVEKKTTPQRLNTDPPPKAPMLAIFLGLVASVGGFMFGYESGQISGYFQMKNYAQRFGELGNDGNYHFSAVRQGTIIANICAGALVGSLVAGRLADIMGRRLTVSCSAFFCMIGKVLEIASTTYWAQFAVGRFVGGIGIGALSVVVPMYQSECAPKAVRGVLISSYQLFITLGIWTGYMVDYGTNGMPSSASWRIPEGLSFLWAAVLGGGILFLPESPRYAYRMGKEEEARINIARLSGIEVDHKEVVDQIHDIQEKIEEESAQKEVAWYEIFTGPRMAYRTILGVVLQAGQQLTGANFLFYYGTTVFSATGLSNSYVTQIILGTVNVVCTFGGLWVAAKCGRRKALMIGAAWSFMCFMIYSLVGHFMLNNEDPQSTPVAGNILIVFSCLFIVAFATTWGPLVWAIVAELYPARYRAQCMALATASNWLWNFLISFFTTVIVEAIHWLYGLVFAGSSLALFFIVYFFLIESKDRSLEEIDTMYVNRVNPITSANYTVFDRSRHSSGAGPEDEDRKKSTPESPELMA
ncbi:general substrate transporter [Myriangium duriaei CBS 260.36]|uniref:General substrate transporter n=1 Tax=Myriangium duriaei CBS 260.36 TaxID=1168546 RepID=A0A9P4JBG2_9PEZI|nr:general substrate transporter [Myriangium duriaei CBS 260.36]